MNVIEPSDIKYLKKMNGPLMLSWDITNRCNMNCIHCYNRSNDSSVHEFNEELNDKEVHDLLGQIVEVYPYSVCICGGEPLLSPYVFDAVGVLSKTGITVNMVSNGFFITDETAMKLKASGLSLIQISLDGINAGTHDTFRRTPDAHTRAIMAIKACISAGILVAVSFSPTRHNIRELEDTIDFLVSIGCYEIRLMPLLPMGRGLENANQIKPSADDYFDLQRILCKKKLQYQNARVVFEWGDPLEHIYMATVGNRDECISMEVKANGDVGVSTYIPLMVGNTRRHRLKEYWEHGFNRIWSHERVRYYSEKIRTLEDFKRDGLQTWNQENERIDIIEEKHG